MPALGVFTNDLGKVVKPQFPEENGVWDFDEDDYLLYALLCDPVNCAELLGDDPGNRAYGGCFKVRDYQYPLFRTGDNYAGFTCGRSVGKALADDEPVLTPDGWTPIADLRVGDLVLGGDGHPTPVLGTYPQGDRPAWEVTFGDGSTVVCDEEHLWTVTCDTWHGHYRQGRMSEPVKTRRLRDLAATAARYKTPLPGVAHFAPRAIPKVDPWLVGALLGDGNLTRPTMIRFANVDEHILERFRTALPADAELVHDGGCNYRVRSREYVLARPGQRSPGRLAHELLRWTRELGLQGKAAHEKRVPEEYLWGSPAVRLEVLRGLVDTDGSITHAGSVEVSSASRGLAEDIAFLARSLGGRASIRTSRTSRRDRHRVVFRIAGIVPCSLPRKVERCGVERHRDTAWRGIASIKPTGRDVPMTCIEVAASDGLFITRDFVVTHNTESIKWRAVSHAFRRLGENLLLTAPELIHLLPLTDAIEHIIRSCRLTREFLDTRGQKTGFTHRPFGADFVDGTKIVGRIPRLTGTGVKGQHEPDLIVDEGQDYPPKGWTEVHETVLKDHVDQDGNPDFTYHFYGVHSGSRDSGFHRRASQGGFKIIQITALQREGWSVEEKTAAKAAYGGTSAPDYRRNILGEPGAAASAYFVTSRLVNCMDTDRESDYNQRGYRHQQIRVEEFEENGLPIREVLDLPSGLKNVYGGMDIGLTNSPTVITLWTLCKLKGVTRLKLVRRFHLERLRTRTIREACYEIGWFYGAELKGFGMDITGLGFPIWQEMEDDEACPPNMRPAHDGGVARGYFFNAKVPVGVDRQHVTTDGQGRMRDMLGAQVTEEVDPNTGGKRYITHMPMIEASTRYLREMVDTTLMLLPFDTEITSDMQMETQQRVNRVAGLKNKPCALHILDSMRAMAMAYRADEVEAELSYGEQVAVLDVAL